MREYKSVKKSFEDCSFSITLPKIIVVDPYINVNFSVGFAGKNGPVKYMIKECMVIDRSKNKVVIIPEYQNNFTGPKKHSIVIDDNKLDKRRFTLTITVLTMNGEAVEATYLKDGNLPIRFQSASKADMTEEEKALFLKELDGKCKKPVSPEPPVLPVPPEHKHDMDEYIEAVSSELRFLKHNGGKKYKVTNGRMLTADLSEFCYSFELETELYLSDDAPVLVTRGLEKVNGTVVVCDGFQIIVSLEHNIGKEVSSAHISVEPWKLLEKLRDNIRKITPDDHIAWKLFHQGPVLASGKSEINRIRSGQEAAIRHAFDEDITVIWGPPGTGKTYTMARMTEKFVSMGKTVLIVSHSNISVDNVVKQIDKQFSESHLKHILPQGKVLRYGFVRDEELSCNENCVAFNYALNNHTELREQYITFLAESKKLKNELQLKQNEETAVKIKEVEKTLKNIRAKLKTETQMLAAKAQVLATTVSKIYMDKLFEDKVYDVVMFDEVSMAYVPQLLCSATFAREKFICVGDFRQLAPIVQSKNSKTVLQKDIFEFLNICRHNDIYNHPWLIMLNEQRRMHPHISQFANKEVYKGLLKDHPSVVSKWDDVVSCEPLEETAVALIDLYGTFCAASKNADNSRFNIVSAVLSFATALEAERSQDVLDFKEEEKVGIITPYAAQTRLIRAMIQDYRQKDTTAISCATVHQFQGSERNVVVFDAVESYPFIRPGWLVSKNENGSVIRLINVALTRARGKFITLANTRFWNNRFHETKNTYFRLLEHIRSHNTVVGIEDDYLTEFIGTLYFGKNIRLYHSAHEAWELLCKDIDSAKKKIVITLPTDNLNEQYNDVIYDAISKRARAGVIILCKAKKTAKLDEKWKSLTYRSKDTVFPLFVIDDRITWYGFPVVDLFFEDKEYQFVAKKSPVFRITGKHTNEMIYSLCDLDYRIDDRGIRIRMTEKINSSAGRGFDKFIQDEEKCKECGSQMKLHMTYNGKYMIKCSKCGHTDFISKFTLNKYLDKINAKCAVCGKEIYAGIGPYGIYVKCSGGHYTKLSEI